MTRAVLALGLILFTTVVHAQQPQEEGAPSVLTVQTTLVQVPVQVKTKSGKNVFALTADNFLVTDNGTPQQIAIDDDAGAQPLALAVVVETGGAGAQHLYDYRVITPILDALIGNVPRRVGLIGFDSTPHLVQSFTPATEEVTQQLATLQSGDNGAAILDAVAFAVTQLRQQPSNYRRAILLISETVDQGSNTSLTDALRLISDTNTTMYTFGFSSTSTAVRHEASKFHYGVGADPGPAHGCFSRDGADAEYEGHYSKQVLDCISQLTPPLRLATLAFVAARGALRTNTSESIAHLTGGEFAHFKNARDLQKGLIALINDVPNFYVLSFRPQEPTPGMHALRVEMKDKSPFEVKARTSYWIEEK